MENYYIILGISSAASMQEIRRAYRILARRYHPDVNPGAESEAKFKTIAEAYKILNDPKKKSEYDAKLSESESATRERHRAFSAYDHAAKHAQTRRTRTPPAWNKSEWKEEKISEASDTMDSWASRLKDLSFNKTKTRLKNLFPENFPFSKRSRTRRRGSQIDQLLIVEASISVFDAIKGVKKSVEIGDEKKSRKASVTIPPGARNGSIIRFRDKNNPSEELVIIVKVAAHPTLSITQRGIIVEVPVTVNEAIYGGQIQVPALDGQATIVVMPGSSSGSEVRLAQSGISAKDGSRGDIFYRLQVKVPDAPDAVGLKEKTAELDKYYSQPVRKNFGLSIFEL